MNDAQMKGDQAEVARLREFKRGRDMALRLGFSDTEATLIATIISELARNIVLYAMSGEIRIESRDFEAASVLLLVAMVGVILLSKKDLK